MGRRKQDTLSFTSPISEQYFEALSRFSYSCTQHVGKQIGKKDAFLAQKAESRVRGIKKIKVSRLTVLPDWENQRGMMENVGEKVGSWGTSWECVERLLIACLFGVFLSELCHIIHGGVCEEKYPPTFCGLHVNGGSWWEWCQRLLFGCPKQLPLNCLQNGAGIALWKEVALKKVFLRFCCCESGKQMMYQISAFFGRLKKNVVIMLLREVQSKQVYFLIKQELMLHIHDMCELFWRLSESVGWVVCCGVVYSVPPPPRSS